MVLGRRLLALEQILARPCQCAASASMVPTPVASNLLHLDPAHSPSDQTFCSHLLGGQACIYPMLVSCTRLKNSSTNIGPGRSLSSFSSAESTGVSSIVADPNSPLRQEYGIAFIAFAYMVLQAFVPVLFSACPPPPPLTGLSSQDSSQVALLHLLPPQ